MTGTIFIDCDSIVEVTGVADSDGNWLNAATVQVTLYIGDTPTEVSGVTWPITLSNVADGKFQGTIPDDAVLTPCMLCRAEFSIDAGAGLKRVWEALYEAKNSALDKQILLYNTDNVLRVVGLEDNANPGTYYNGATVQLTLYDSAGVEIPNVAWPVTMAYVGNPTPSDGDFETKLADTLDVSEGDNLRALITADAGTDQYREWRSQFLVQKGT